MAEKKNGTGKTIAWVVVIILAFGGGVAVGKKKTVHDPGSTGPSVMDFQSMSPEERRATFSDGDHGGFGGGRNGFGGSGSSRFRGGSGVMTVGEVLSIDEGSITIDLGEEGSKLILLTDETSVLKTQDVGLEGLSEGDNVFVNGETSDDGSVIAQTVTVQPEGFGTRTMEEQPEKTEE